MDLERLEALWAGGDAASALAYAEAEASAADPLPLAEALLRCAAVDDRPEWEAAANLAVRLREHVWPQRHPRAGYAAMPLADLLRRRGRMAEAETVLRRCEALAAEGGDSEALRDAVFARARLHLAQGRDDEAEAALRRAIEIEERERHPLRPPFTLPLMELQALYLRQGRDAEAAAIVVK